MPPKLMCDICEEGSFECKCLPLFMANGAMKHAARICEKCIGNKRIKCLKHKNELFVFFIDASAVCPICVEKKARENYHLDPKSYEELFSDLSEVVSPQDAAEFMDIMRLATMDDASPGQCLAFALEAFAQRKNRHHSISRRYGRRIVKKARSFFSILPSKKTKARVNY